jgi:hypothetical protein
MIDILARLPVEKRRAIVIAELDDVGDGDELIRGENGKRKPVEHRYTVSEYHTHGQDGRPSTVM